MTDNEAVSEDRRSIVRRLRDAFGSETKKVMRRCWFRGADLRETSRLTCDPVRSFLWTSRHLS
jgi:hypothetical protein